jgi:hypothetical protein
VKNDFTGPHVIKVTLKKFFFSQQLGFRNIIMGNMMRTYQYFGTEGVCNIHPTPIQYPLLIGTNLGIKLDFDTYTVTWEESTIPFKPIYARVENINEHFPIEESDATKVLSD